MPVTIIDERPSAALTVRGAVLFADLRGYTALAERLPPLTVVALLEEFFALLADSVERDGGTVFHSAGDSIMAGFGIGEPGPESEAAAFVAGRRIVAGFAPVSERWQARHGVLTGVGVGVHAGELALAEIGQAAFRRRTLIGDTVNVAARLCQRARAGEVLLSAGIADRLDPGAAREVIALPDLSVRGRDGRVRIFCLPARQRLLVERPPPAAGPLSLR
jgi:adenylate cyclase